MLLLLLLFVTFSGFAVCFVVFALSAIVTAAGVFGSAFRSPTVALTAATTSGGGGGGCGCCCCLMVVLIPMLMLLLLMMPLRHCREHLLTNGFGHRRHFDVPLCPLNSIPVVEFWRRWWAAAAPGHTTH